MRATVLTSRVTLVVACLVAAAGRADDQEWQPVTVKDNVTVERRVVAGSKLYETRALTSSPLTPAQIFAVLWDRRAYTEFVPYIKYQDVLKETENEVLVYDQVKVPLVSDRDYVVWVRRQIDTQSQVHKISFHSADPEGPPQAKGHVRARNIRGSWLLEPKPTGGTAITYTLYSEPGGWIPNWIVNLTQKKEVPKFLRLMLRRAEEKSAGR
jgi:hypothetical protein